ncbi:MAG TPA: glycosyltransferase family 39 protein [Steroidobacter sp.]
MADSPTRPASLAGLSVVTAAWADFFRWLTALFESTVPATATARDRVATAGMLAVILLAGGFTRFWGLDNVGLHGDEETMAMAVRHIVEEGTPILPSGMLYPRGLTQLYLMAASVRLFGESEWALRLPSAICGVVMIALVFAAGRRFLRPHWNLALTASVAFLPHLITYSQTARMYIFMLTAIAAAMVCIFAWERNGKTGWLLGAVAAFMIGIDFQPLAVTVTPLLLLPGLLQRDMRKLTGGLAAMAVVLLFYVFFDGWVNAQYPVPPKDVAEDVGPPPIEGTAAPYQPLALSFQVALWVAGLAAAFLAFRLGRLVQPRSMSIVVTLLMFGVVLCQLLLMYHVAAILFIVSFVMARRNSAREMLVPFCIFGLGCAVIALIHGTALASRPGSIIQIVGAMVGQPSVWPYVRIAEFAPVAAVLAGVAVAIALFNLSSRAPATDYALLAVSCVWVPLFAIGFILWNVPPRYTAASLLPLLLCAFAFAQRAVDWMSDRWISPARARAFQAIAAIVVTVLVVNPVRTVAAVNTDYSSHPDHKGAAEFMQSLGFTEDDVLIAEDVLQQTYYLGKVDYWLLSRKYARRFVERVNGRILDFYTHTPVIMSAADLEAVLAENRDRRIFIIGSGENQRDGRRDMRGDMYETLTSGRFPVIYTGRDGLTKIWRIEPQAARQVSPVASRQAVAATAPASSAASE